MNWLVFCLSILGLLILGAAIAVLLLMGEILRPGGWRK